MQPVEKADPPPAYYVVETDQIESAIGQKLIGERIRRLRSRRSLGLVELGKQTGLSASFLSQLETGRVVPTIRNLARIAMTFNKDLSYFFREEEAVSFRVLNSNERVKLQRGVGEYGSFVTENLSTIIPNHSMLPSLAEFRAVDEDVAFTPRTAEGIEFALVISGKLSLVSENETKMLEEGDVAWLDAMRPRQYICSQGESAQLIVVHRNKQG